MIFERKFVFKIEVTVDFCVVLVINVWYLQQTGAGVYLQSSENCCGHFLWSMYSEKK